MNNLLLKLSKSTFWHEKPLWCQPWSIISTGISIVFLSILWPSLIWFTSIVTIIILLWWVLFLFIAPIEYYQLYDQKKVTDNE